MDLSLIMPFVMIIVIIFFVILGIAGLFKAFYAKVDQGFALIVNDMSSKPKVSFTGAMVLPVIHRKEIMKISLITLQVDRRGHEGLICKDNLRADISVAFYLRVNETVDDVLTVAKTVGVARASNKEAVDELFNAKFSEALKTVGKQMDFLELFENRIQFRENIIEVIGDDLSGYVLEDVAIDYLEQTPKSELDPNNILDAEGIRRITEITAHQNVETNRLEKDEQLAIKKKNVETKESTLALEKQQADAEIKQAREIATIKAREEAEISRVQEEERQKAESARIEADEDLAVREEGKQRQIEIAAENRRRAVVIEQEKVEKARALEQVNREREVELEQISKEKALEEERKVIAQTVSERISVDKKVAEEEERINDVRRISEAEREKKAAILSAEADAEEELVKQVKAAEAEQQKANFKAKEINIIAEAELEAAAKEAEAMKKKAEGVEAERAAPGFADAKVREALADAIEKEGISKARADEAAGLSKAKVIEAQASAKEKEGLAEAKVLEEKLGAKAKGEEDLGLAQATAEKQKGLAEAEILREKAKAEAEGLIEKFNAMSNMSGEAREFEEFRMKLEVAFQEAMATIEANKDIAKDQAEVLSTALAKAKIDIVSGDGEYFENFAKALSVGNAINGMVGKSPMVKTALDKIMNLTNELEDTTE